MTPPSMPRLKPKQAAKAKPACLFVAAMLKYDPPNLVAEIPIRLVSESNQHVHWRVKAGRVKAQRDAVARWLGQVDGAFFAGELIVTVTRIAPRLLDEHDNLPSACKASVDAIAQWLGLKNDRDPRVRWSCEQVQRAAKTYGVAIRVEVTQPDDYSQAKTRGTST